MGLDSSDSAYFRGQPRPLSGRALTALQQHQRRVALLEKDMQHVDRILAGALSACNGASQLEMLGTYLEAVQELRVGLQRLEQFLLHKLVDGDPRSAADPRPGPQAGWPDPLGGI